MGLVICVVFLRYWLFLRPQLVAQVTISTQTMTVIHRGRVIHNWKVSTARRGKVTPVGSWTAPMAFAQSPLQPLQQCADALFHLLQRALCGAWNRSDQPPGHARLGRLHPASSGQCGQAVRAAQQVGLKNMRIVVRR
jgi:hypothetical protein